MGRRAAGTGTVQEVRLSPLPMRKAIAATMFRLRQAAVRVSERGVRGLRPASMRLQKEDEGESEACRRKRARHSAHGMHHVLAPGRHTYVRQAVHGVVIWQTAGVLQGRR